MTHHSTSILLDTSPPLSRPSFHTLLSTLREEAGNAARDGWHVVSLAAGGVVGIAIFILFARILPHNSHITFQEAEEFLPWTLHSMQPEPWERILFAGGLMIVPAAALVAWGILTLLRRDGRMHRFIVPSIAVILAIGMLSSFLLLLPSIWKALAIVAPEAGRPHTTLLPVDMTEWLLTALFAVLTGAAFLLRNRLSRWKMPVALEAVIVGALVLLLVYAPQFYRALDTTYGIDFAWFLTPAHDVLRGKHLLVESESLYGLLPFYALAPLFALTGTTATAFAYVLTFLHLAYYALLYVLCRTLFAKRWHAVLAFFLALSWTFLQSQTLYEVYGLPSTSRFRNFLDVPLFLCLAMELRTGKFRWFVAAAGIASIALFSNVDLGLALAVTLPAYVAARALFLFHDARTTVHVLLLHWSVQVALSFGVFLLLSQFILFLSGHWPNWSRYTAWSRLFLNGLNAIPMPAIGSWWLIMVTYVVSLITVTVAWLGKRRWITAPLLFALSVYGIIAFVYYLNRSYINNLWVIAFPAALCLILLVSPVLERRRSTPAHAGLDAPWLRVPLLLTLLFLFSIAAARAVTASHFMAERRYGTQEPAVPWLPPDALAAAVQSIQTRIPSGKRAAVLSDRDHVFTLAADRPNAFHYPLLISAFTVTDLVRGVETFTQEKHPFLFVDNAPLDCKACPSMQKALLRFYRKQATEGVLDIYEWNGP